MSLDSDLFLSRYQQLNEQQRDAVDTIYGPVMVIAGPGTGKTEVLAMRIANLLRSEAQVQPQEILCLTYTDEAANAMRRRLLQIIGPDAQRVVISTFHAFSNNIIQSHPELFSFRDLEIMSELDRYTLLHALLDELPQGHPLQRSGASVYYDAKSLYALFEVMKKENLSPEYLSQCVDTYLADLPNREKFRYKRNGQGFQKGDLKQHELDAEMRRMETTRAAALLFPRYQELMQEKGFYDYSDMLLWVLRELKSNEALLQSYQERFQFILVDEFQDTNGAQSELLTTLTSFWENPNIFVVGDDDQSIYEFQGARIRNIIDFYERHSRAVKLITLPQNYRSSQAILDRAAATIACNKQRLVYQLTHLNLDKNIRSANNRFQKAGENVQPEIRVYPNLAAEEADVVNRIEQLRQSGVPYHEIALIYAQHKQVENIISLFERRNIPYQTRKAANALQEPVIAQILLVLRYIAAERQATFSGEPYLFEILHAPYYEIAPADLARLSLFIQQQSRQTPELRYWRMLLANGMTLQLLNLHSEAALIRMGHNLDNWLQAVSHHPLPLLLEKIIYESGIANWLLQGSNYVWDMQVLHTFFRFVRLQYYRQPQLKLADFLQLIDKMQLEGISLPVEQVIQSETGVRCYTAHSAKGNEFEHVFLIGCTDGFWEKKTGNNRGFSLPDTVTFSEEKELAQNTTEVARRLFYVALTRARKYLYVSYARQDYEGRELNHSLFVDEICKSEERIPINPAPGALLRHLQWGMEPADVLRIELANRDWIERCVQQLTMSYTTLSKFLNCPLRFYYECILKVPSLPGPALGFGIAVHNALERFFNEMKANGEFGTAAELISFFEQSLWREKESMNSAEYQRRLEQGRSVLAAYYERNSRHWHRNVEVEVKVPRFYLDGIPVTGKIDKLEIETDGNTCTVIDYKTGNPGRKEHLLPPHDKNPLGGDYWRQVVFYKLLLENNPDKRYKVRIGAFDYIEPDRKTGTFRDLVYVPVSEADETTVRQQLKDAYGRIMNHDFDTGCGKKDCSWCQFARQYRIIRQPEESFVEIDDV